MCFQRSILIFFKSRKITKYWETKCQLQAQFGLTQLYLLISIYIKMVTTLQPSVAPIILTSLGLVPQRLCAQAGTKDVLEQLRLNNPFTFQLYNKYYSRPLPFPPLLCYFPFLNRSWFSLSKILFSRYLVSSFLFNIYCFVMFLWFFSPQYFTLFLL